MEAFWYITQFEMLGTNIGTREEFAGTICESPTSDHHRKTHATRGDTLAVSAGTVFRVPLELTPQLRLLAHHPPACARSPQVSDQQTGRATMVRVYRAANCATTSPTAMPMSTNTTTLYHFLQNHRGAVSAGGASGFAGR